MIILRIAGCDYVPLITIYSRCKGRCGWMPGTVGLGGPGPVPSWGQVCLLQLGSGEGLGLFCKWYRKGFSNFNVHTSPQGILIPLVLVGPRDAAFRASSQVVLMLLVINHSLNSDDGKMSGNENDISCIPQAAEKLVPPASWKYLLTEPCPGLRAVSCGHKSCGQGPWSDSYLFKSSSLALYMQKESHTCSELSDSVFYIQNHKY